MAAPGGKFFIADKLGVKAKHHESYQQLWETKWKQPVGILSSEAPALDCNLCQRALNYRTTSILNHLYLH